MWVHPSDPTNRIRWYMSRNDCPSPLCNGSEGFPRIWSGIPSGTPNALPQELHTIWLSVMLWEIPPSETDDWWLKRSALASSQLGRKESARYYSVSCSYTKPSLTLAPSLAELCNHCKVDLLNSTVRYLDGISNTLRCVSQHWNRSMVVVSSKNPQNNKGGDFLLLWKLSQHQIIT